MTATLIISLFCISVFGYYVVAGVDRFLARGGIADSPQGRANKGILVYGSPQTAAGIQKAGMKYRVIESLPIPEDGNYSALFALSEDDFGNLAVCKAARRLDPGIYMVARCGTEELRSSFVETGVTLLLSQSEPVEPLLAGIIGEGL
ncbi:hypothetical protein SDC9_84157 [bioreactor metagenome]|uniref:RCK N-terminal domain-containing protein n=1 Tax=bioreactor metagenome TaxID=1076179 RepID=A0A644ZA15_9ZZZZ